MLIQCDHIVLSAIIIKKQQNQGRSFNNGTMTSEIRVAAAIAPGVVPADVANVLTGVNRWLHGSGRLTPQDS